METQKQKKVKKSRGVSATLVILGCFIVAVCFFYSSVAINQVLTKKVLRFQAISLQQCTKVDLLCLSSLH